MKNQNIIQKFKGTYLDIVNSSAKSCLLICFLTVLCFINIFPNDFVLDDIDFIVNWSLTHDLNNFVRFFVRYIPPDGQEGIYSPLRTLIFAINYHFWELNPLGYHLVSILTHLAGTWMIYRLTLLLIANRNIAFLTALFFGIHPIHVESVTSMTGSIDTIGVVFMFVAFYYYIKATGYEGTFYLKNEAPENDKKGKNKKSADLQKKDLTSYENSSLKLVNLRDYYYSLIWALLAIFTHELTVTIPVLFLFYDYFFRGRKLPLRCLIKRLAPYIVMSIGYVIIKFIVLGAISRGHYLYDSFYLSMMVMIKAWAKYILLIIFPLHLRLNQVIAPGIFAFNQGDYNEFAVLSQSFFDPRTLSAFLILLGTSVWAIYMKKRRPLFTFCVGWFFICLLPVSGIVPSSVFFADRYLYPGSFTFCILLSYFLYSLFKSKKEIRFFHAQTIVVFLTIGIVCFYSIRTITRNDDMRSFLDGYVDEMERSPYGATMFNDLGILYYEHGQFSKAIASFKKAIAMKPDDGHFYFSMEHSLSALELFDESIQALEKAIQLIPDFAEAHYNLAGIYFHLGREDKANEYLSKAMDLYKKQGRILEAGEAKAFFLENKKMRETLINKIIAEQLKQK